jgi:hypothetical protein
VVDRSAHACSARAKHGRDLGSARRLDVVQGRSQIRWAAGYRSCRKKQARCFPREGGHSEWPAAEVPRRERSGSADRGGGGQCPSQGKGWSRPPLRIAAMQPFDFRARVWLRPGGLVATPGLTAQLEAGS